MKKKETVKKEIDLSNLPKWGKEGMGNEGTINWNNSIGYKVNGIYDEVKFEIEILKYNKEAHKLIIKFNEKEYKISTDGLKNCKLGKILGKYTSEFKIEIGEKFQDSKRDITIIDREYRPKYKKDRTLKQNEKWYKYHCNIDGYEDWMVESNIFQGNGCMICAGRLIIKGYNTIVDTDSWMIPYFQGGYDEAKLYNKHGSGNSNNPNGIIQPVCPDCGRIKNKKITIESIYTTHSIGCSCGKSISFPNKFAYNLLEQLNIDFIAEYSPSWIGRKRYDFYFKIDNKEYILEMDGELGHGNKNYKSKTTSNESKLIDNYKDEQAKLHGIEIIRIDCVYVNNDRFEYIKNNVLNNEDLNKLFDLSKIDWNKIEEFALSNLVKTICEYKKDNPNMTTTEMGKIFKLSNTTIASYLKRGNKYGWCNYIGYDEFIKNNLRNSEKNKLRNGKQVLIFKDNTCLGKFDSCKELENNSEKLFREKLDSKSISAVAYGTRKTYKGYVFKYVSDLTQEEIKQYKIID